MFRKVFNPFIVNNNMCLLIDYCQRVSDHILYSVFNNKINQIGMSINYGVGVLTNLAHIANLAISSSLMSTDGWGDPNRIKQATIEGQFLVCLYIMPKIIWVMYVTVPSMAMIS